MELDKLKIKRTPLRRLFTKSINEFEEVYKEERTDKNTLLKLLDAIEDKATRLFEIDSQVSSLLLAKDDIDSSELEEAYSNELEASEAYREKWVALKFVKEELTRPKGDISKVGLGGDSEAKGLGQSSSVPFNSLPQLNVNENRNLRLPRIEIKSFDGNIRNWISFWGQFRKIHEDENLQPEDKFHYLYQATVPGTPPRELVSSYPPSGDNYLKAIELLKSRFARDELLIEVYVRDLLGIVLDRSKQSQPLPLSSLYDKIVSKLHSLDTLGVTSEKYAAMLFPLVESAIPDETLKAWERHRSQYRPASTTDKEKEKETNNQMNYLTLLLDFLKVEVESEERLKLARSSFNTSAENPEPTKFMSRKAKPKDCSFSQPTAATFLTSETKGKHCLFCSKPHATTDCVAISTWSLEEKRSGLKKSGGCFVCLKPGHGAKACKSYVKCLICKKRHHTIMCPNLSSEKDEVGLGQKISKVTESNKSENNGESSNVLFSQQMSPCYLQTLIVNIKSSKGYRPTRVLLDSGSQRSYMSKSCISDLELVSVGEETISHCLFGGVQVNHIKHNLYNVELKGLYEYFSCQVQVLDQEKICNFIPHFDDRALYEALKHQNIILTDIANNLDVELLLGADVLGGILTNESKPVNNGLTAVKTKLGWTIMGLNEKKVNSQSTFCCSNLNSVELSQLWKLDVLGISDPVEGKERHLLEEDTMNHFNQTVTQDETGRFTVQLPWIEGHPQLANNYDLAARRLESTTKRLVNIDRINDYDNVFRDWEDSDIISRMKTDSGSSRTLGHVIPHHAVIKESSLTTKVRPVFDASAKDKNGNSLNECLIKGPNLVELIPDILLKFRLGNIGVSADIAKAFLQIKVQEKDQEFLQFLWWKDKEYREIQMFKHTRVMFGLKSSPFLLGAVLKHLLDNAPKDLIDTANKLKGSFYVDNFVTSVDSETELRKVMEEAKYLLSLGKFDLRDWAYSRDIGDEITPTHLLGLNWDRKADTISCNVKPVNLASKPLTKRVLLSVAQSVFDPVGFTSPVTLVPKLLLQDTWKLKLKWDEPLPKEIEKKFNQWLAQIHLLNNCAIPRKVSDVSLADGECTYHVFSDASKLAYSACVFLRVETKDKVSVQLLAAKSRISPCKEITIPRLELLGAVIATRLFKNVEKSLSLDCKVFFWSDSSVVLTWIKRKDDWNTFVANRCREIRENTDPKNWNHIPGQDNPADLPSRGCNIEQLCRERWWEGPEWLRKKEEDWPKTKLEVSENEVNKEKKKCVVSASNSSRSNILQHFENTSKYCKILRTTGWIWRFIDNTRNSKKTSGELTSEEITRAEKTILKLVQDHGFQNKMEDKSLKRLQVFQDDDGILHVKSRLVMTEDSEEFKYPILLPSKSSIVQKLIRHYHIRNQHIGVQMLMNVLRENFWILGGRKSIKTVLAQCVKCKRHSARPMEAPCAPLPKERITQSMVFEVTGVDLAGPLFLKGGEKTWIVLFTCAVYRAVHLELVKSLSTEAFLQALRRFIARRGRPVTMYSDNGKNFVGASNAFKKLDWDTITRETSVQKIKWKFNPPTAAWWGGWWERLIGMLKGLLRRNLGRSSLHYEELYTVLCDCEGILNARPLTYVSSDGEDLIPLSPATFLQNLKTNEVVDLDNIDRSSLVCRLNYLQKLREDLRARFRKEYLGLFVHQRKANQMQIDIGDIVLVGDEGLKRVLWPLAVVTKLYPGKDQIVRAVQLKTSTGKIVRPIQKLYPLELTSSADKSEDTPPLKHVLEELQKTSKQKREDCGKRVRSGRMIKIPNRLDL